MHYNYRPLLGFSLRFDLAFRLGYDCNALISFFLYDYVMFNMYDMHHWIALQGQGIFRGCIICKFNDKANAHGHAPAQGQAMPMAMEY